jgi:hypothetical protein
MALIYEILPETITGDWGYSVFQWGREEFRVPELVRRKSRRRETPPDPVLLVLCVALNG